MSIDWNVTILSYCVICLFQAKGLILCATLWSINILVLDHLHNIPVFSLNHFIIVVSIGTISFLTSWNLKDITVLSQPINSGPLVPFNENEKLWELTNVCISHGRLMLARALRLYLHTFLTQLAEREWLQSPAISPLESYRDQMYSSKIDETSLSIGHTPCFFPLHSSKLLLMYRNVFFEYMSWKLCKYVFYAI